MGGMDCTGHVDESAAFPNLLPCSRNPADASSLRRRCIAQCGTRHVPAPEPDNSTSEHSPPSLRPGAQASSNSSTAARNVTARDHGHSRHLSL